MVRDIQVSYFALSSKDWDAPHKNISRWSLQGT